MAIRGRASVLSEEDWERVFNAILKNRHPEKNTAIMKLSKHLGLKAQEIVAIRINDIAILEGNDGLNKRALTLRKELRIAPRATPENRSRSKYTRKSLTFTISEFNATIENVVSLVKSDITVDPTDFYPAVKKKSSTPRLLPLSEISLVRALNIYLKQRLASSPFLKNTDPLFVSQKGGAYSPNTLQEHMALILKDWAGISKATSNSGRRGLVTNVLETHGVIVAQKVAGNRSLSSVAISYNDANKSNSKKIKK
ncbi:site-specific integrase [Paraglaciecola chathamensis]|uniref:Tyr recombinase domain-containing protein n=1 Tax=Paraglaciecola chathamensis S18K6 TaxID=1127672 RepID=A0AAV3UT60_9ALTE|nr:tyrosine-type recombinase/integrase [Paraglaciecola chathamensis]GAC08257.1 hypothetical protein GCHA_0292 [Paraglaciecola chathamensis S18K6]